jgi:hypothetical protein
MLFYLLLLLLLLILVLPVLPVLQAIAVRLAILGIQVLQDPPVPLATLEMMVALATTARVKLAPRVITAPLVTQVLKDYPANLVLKALRENQVFPD